MPGFPVFFTILFIVSQRLRVDNAILKQSQSVIEIIIRLSDKRKLKFMNGQMILKTFPDSITKHFAAFGTVSGTLKTLEVLG